MSFFIKLYYKVVIWVLVISYLCFAPADDFKQVNISIPHFDKIVHFGMFFILGVFLSAINNLKYSKLHSFWLPVIAILYGGAVEIIQFNYINSRSGDFIDWIADIIGLLIGIWIFRDFPKIFRDMFIYK